MLMVCVLGCVFGALCVYVSVSVCRCFRVSAYLCMCMCVVAMKFEAPLERTGSMRWEERRMEHGLSLSLLLPLSSLRSFLSSVSSWSFLPVPLFLSSCVYVCDCGCFFFCFSLCSVFLCLLGSFEPSYDAHAIRPSIMATMVPGNRRSAEGATQVL